MKQRGDQFFDDQIRLTRAIDLLNSSKLKGEFENNVIADSSVQVERQVTEFVDWMIEKQSNQWKSIETLLIVSDLSNKYANTSLLFHSNRKAILSRINSEVHSILSSFNKEKEAQSLTEEVRSSLLQTVVLQVGAVSVGTLLSTLLFDFTGLLGFSALAISGLALVPIRKRQLKEKFSRKVEEMRHLLASNLEVQFNKELDETILTIHEKIAPFKQFVMTENERLANSKQSLENKVQLFDKFRAEVDHLAPSKEKN